MNALDFKASGLLDDAESRGAANEKAPETLSATKKSSRRTSKHVVVRETRRHSADAETPEPMPMTTTKTPKTPAAAESHSVSASPVSLAGAGDVRAVLPASDATAASADDFLSDLSPAATARVSARLGALRDLDAELERAVDDERSDDEGKKGQRRESAGTSAFVEASSRGFPLEASLGGSKSLWDKVQTLFGAAPAAAEPAATVGSCLCACPGAGSGRADACYASTSPSRRTPTGRRRARGWRLRAPTRTSAPPPGWCSGASRGRRRTRTRTRSVLRRSRRRSRRRSLRRKGAKGRREGKKARSEALRSVESPTRFARRLRRTRRGRCVRASSARSRPWARTSA